MYISALLGPLWSCLHQKNTRSFADLQRLFDLTMKIHFKTTWRKKLRTPSRTNLRRYSVCFSIHGSPHWPQILSTIHGFFTLAASNKLKIIRSKKYFRSTCVSTVKKKSSSTSTKPHLRSPDLSRPPRDVVGPKKNGRRKHPDLPRSLLPLLLLLLLAMECVWPCCST